MGIKAESVTIGVNNTAPQITFAIEQLVADLAYLGIDGKVKNLSSITPNDAPIVRIGLTSSKGIQRFLISNGIAIGTIQEQGFIIKTASSRVTNYIVISGDNNGLMYGILELAEQIKAYGYGVKISTEQAPQIKKRGVKICLPLDARSPGYDSDGDDAKLNLKTIYDINFWHQYIDELAKMEYNVLAFDNLHPFPSMCVIDDYPLVALKGVFGFDSTLVNRLKMKKKIAYWNKVFDYAQSRGFEIHWFNRNINANGAQWKHKITNKADDNVLKDYSAKALYSFLETYPQIDVFGSSDNNTFGAAAPARVEKWLYDVWGATIDYFNQRHPSRNIKYLHSTQNTNMDAAMKQFSALRNTQFDFLFPYSGSHMYGCTNPLYTKIDGFVEGLEKYRVKTWLELNNNDFFYFRWSDYDYAQAYFLNMPNKRLYLNGYYVNSDVYTFTKTHSYQADFESENGTLEINKHWFNLYLWGKLGYNPHLKKERLEALTAASYPGSNGKLLYNSWAKSSALIPEVNKLLGGGNAESWYAEGCFSLKGFVDVDKMAFLSPQPGSNTYSIMAYIKILKADRAINQFTPIEKSRQLGQQAQEALRLANRLEKLDTLAYNLLVTDIKAMSHLGIYYSHKIEGTFWYQYGDLGKAENSLTLAKKAMKEYTTLAASQYKGQYFGHFNSGGRNSGKWDNKFDWNLMMEGAENDLRLIKQLKVARANRPKQNLKPLRFYKP